MTATPNGKVNLDLDSLEREAVVGVQGKREPYAVVFHGKRIEFADPAELPYETLLVMDSHPSRFFRSTLSEEDNKHFQTHAKDLVGFKLRALMQGYRDYYGVDELGNDVGSRR